MRNCHICGYPIHKAWARVIFQGFDTLALNGVEFVVHAACLRFEATPALPAVDLPPRISDPVAEPDDSWKRIA